MVYRLARRLKDEHIRTSDILVQLDPCLPVLPLANYCSAKGCFQFMAQQFGEPGVRVSRKELQSSIHVLAHSLA
jgi:hypothetical protein